MNLKLTIEKIEAQRFETAKKARRFVGMLSLIFPVYQFVIQQEPNGFRVGVIELGYYN